MIKLDKGSCQYIFLSPKGVVMRREKKIKRVQKKRLKRSIKKRATTRKMKNRAKRLEQSSGEQSSRCASSPIPSLHKQSARRDQAIHGGRKSSLLPLKATLFAALGLSVACTEDSLQGCEDPQVINNARGLPWLREMR